MKKTCNKIMVALGTLVPVFAFAEGNDYSGVVNTTEAISALTAIKTQLLTWVNSATPLYIAIAGGFMVFWLVIFSLALIKKFSKRAS